MAKVFNLNSDEQYTIAFNNDYSLYRDVVSSPEYLATTEGNEKRIGIATAGSTATVVAVTNNDWIQIKTRDKETDEENTYWIYYQASNSTVGVVDDEENLEKYETAKKAISDRFDYTVVGTNKSPEDYEAEAAAETAASLSSTADTIIIGQNYDADGADVDTISKQYGKETEKQLTMTMRAYGCPPQWTRYVDPRIMTILDSNSHTYVIGRKFAETVISGPTILSLCPGIVEYNDKLGNSSWRSAFTDLTSNGAVSAEDLSDALKDSSGSLIRFTPAYQHPTQRYFTNGEVNGYLAYLDVLSKAFVAYLGRNTRGDTSGDETAQGELGLRQVPGYDFNYLNIEWDEIDGKSDELDYPYTGEKGFKYINFYVTGNVSASEEFDTEVRASTIESTVNGAATATIKDIAFITGGMIDEGANIIGEDLAQAASEATSGLGGVLGSIISSGTAMLEGGKIIFPQIIDDCSYSKSCQFTCKFTSPAGDVESVFWKTLVPLMHLLPFVIPQQIGDLIDMYTYPFLCRAYAKGLYNCPVGVLKSFSVKRGGDDDELWSADGLATEITVSFEIAPLYSKLMLSCMREASDLSDFYKNTGLQEYVATLTGVDLRLGDTDLKVSTTLAILKGWLVDIPERALFEVKRKLGITKLERGWAKIKTYLGLAPSIAETASGIF